VFFNLAHPLTFSLIISCYMLFIFVTGDVLLVTRHSSFVTRHSTHVTRVHPWLTVVKKERGVTPFGMTPLFFNFYELSDVSLYALTKYTLFTSYLTLTVIVFFLPPAVNVTFALPAFFLALILNFASPLASVILLAGVTCRIYLCRYRFTCNYAASITTHRHRHRLTLFLLELQAGRMYRNRRRLACWCWC